MLGIILSVYRSLSLIIHVRSFIIYRSLVITFLARSPLLFSIVHNKSLLSSLF